MLAAWPRANATEGMTSGLFLVGAPPARLLSGLTRGATARESLTNAWVADGAERIEVVQTARARLGLLIQLDAVRRPDARSCSTRHASAACSALD